MRVDDQSHALVELKIEGQRAGPRQFKAQPGSRHARGRKWTTAEDQVLRYYAGEKPMGFILRKLPHRTAEQTRARLYVLGIRLWQGTHTLREAMGLTGYSKSQLLRAREALGQVWMGQVEQHRAPGCSKMVYRITGEQLDALTEYLGGQEPVFVSRLGFQRHRWAAKHERCALCGTNGSKYMERHIADGLCRRCYYEPRCPECGARTWTLRAFVYRAQRSRASKRRRSEGGKP